MAEYLTNDTDLKKVADAIRTKGGTADPLVYPDGFAEAIGNIQTGGGEVCTTYLKWCSPNPFSLAPVSKLGNTESFTGKLWDGIIETSTDKETWTEYDGLHDAPATQSGEEYCLYMRGRGNSRIRGNVNGLQISPFCPDGSEISIYGYIESLIDWETFQKDGRLSLTNVSRQYSFAGNESLPESCSWLIRCPSIAATPAELSPVRQPFLSGTFMNQVNLKTLPIIRFDPNAQQMINTFMGSGTNVPGFEPTTTPTETTKSVFRIPEYTRPGAPIQHPNLFKKGTVFKNETTCYTSAELV